MQPSQIGRFNIVGLPIPLPGDPALAFRRFVVLKHFPIDLYVAALSPITTTQRYAQDPDRAAGCVLYGPKELPGFAVEVAFEPLRTHRHPIRYSLIQQSMNQGTFKEFGPLPIDFHARFLHAIEHNNFLNKKEKQAWCDLTS